MGGRSVKSAGPTSDMRTAGTTMDVDVTGPMGSSHGHSSTSSVAKSHNNGA